VQLDVAIPRRSGPAAPQGRRRARPGLPRVPPRAREARQEGALRAARREERARWEKYNAEGKVDEWLDFRWKDEHTELTQIRVTGGYVDGDRAVVLFDGKNGYIDALHGEAQLRRENGQWLVGGDMVSVGAR
jgi:hypothetical protein